MRKLKIAILRGWYLNPWEMMRYSSLADQFDIHAIGTHHPLFDISGIPLPVSRLHWPGECFYAFGRSAGRLINRGLYKYVRYNQWLFGLDAVLSSCDIIHSADTHHLFSYQAALIRKRHGNKLALTVWENIPFQDERRGIYLNLSRVVREQTDLFLPVTERAKQMLILQGVPDHKIMVIPQPVDLALFRPSAQQNPVRLSLECGKDDTLILTVARLHRSKGIEFLLYAFRRLLQDAPPGSGLKLAIVGTGEQELTLKATADRLGISDRVIWCGGVDHDRLPDYYAAADIFVLPSIPTEEWQEQFGMVLIEALACGRPVVSTLSGSIPDVVEDAGILVQPADATALYQGLRSLVQNPALRERYGKMGRDLAERKYHPTVVAESTATAYHRLAKRGASS